MPAREKPTYDEEDEEDMISWGETRCSDEDEGQPSEDKDQPSEDEDQTP